MQGRTEARMSNEIVSAMTFRLMYSMGHTRFRASLHREIINYSSGISKIEKLTEP